jgi:phage-related protein
MKKRESFSFPIVPVLVIGAAIWFITRPSALLSGGADVVDSVGSGASGIIDSTTSGAGGLLESAGKGISSVFGGLADVVDAITPW